MSKEIKMGDVAKERVTGFTGVVVGITRWENNCDRLQLQPQKPKSDGTPAEAAVFDLPHLSLVKSGKIAAMAVRRPADVVNLGDEVTDTVTGCAGRAVAIASWVNGCSRVGIQSKKLKGDGTPAALFWADESDCKITKRANPKPAVKTGGPRQDPVR